MKKFNVKSFKSDIYRSMNSIESYKAKVNSMLEEGRKNGIMIDSICSDLLERIGDYYRVNEDLDLNYFSEELEKIRKIVGGINENDR